MSAFQEVDHGVAVAQLLGNAPSTRTAGSAEQSAVFCVERLDGPMWRILRSEHGESVRFMLSGRITAEDVPELRRLIEGEDRRRELTLDLQEVKLVDREAVDFLVRCEAARAILENGPAYVREWLASERAASKRPRTKRRTRRNRER
jgi:hypothetical protein